MERLSYRLGLQRDGGRPSSGWKATWPRGAPTAGRTGTNGSGGQGDTITPGGSNSTLVAFRVVSDTQASELGAILALENSTASKRWGVRMMKENGVYILKVQYNNGGGLQYPATLLEGFKFDEWYILLLTAGGSQFHAQAWERDDPAAAGGYTCGSACGLPSASSWHFKQWSYAAAVWLDEYAEGRVYSLSFSQQRSTAGRTWPRRWRATVTWPSAGPAADRDQLHLRRRRQLGGGPAASIHIPWPTRGVCSMATRRAARRATGTAVHWVSYRLSRTRFYPNTSDGKYLVGLPASRSASPARTGRATWAWTTC